MGAISGQARNVARNNHTLLKSHLQLGSGKKSMLVVDSDDQTGISGRHMVQVDNSSRRDASGSDGNRWHRLGPKVDG